MEYNFSEIEPKWRAFWADNKTFKADNSSDKPKFYVLDMFPYPSGAGLHVGHPLGYIASDIYSRFKRLQGFNVLHPMGYDSFGLPAEQYAIQTGLHPKITTSINIDGCIDEKNNIKKEFLNNDGTIKEQALVIKDLKTSISHEKYQENIIKGYRKQLDNIGFSFDWDREVRTSSPEYYKWTQWIFIQLFDCWYNNKTNKAERISGLVTEFEANGNASVQACSDYNGTFSATEWNAFNEQEKEAILQEYRLAYLADSWVNWCPALGTVLANDEIVNGVSERGGHPVEQKLMRQWSMRIKAYAERLIQGLENVEWTDSIKDIQRNWIGKSIGASVRFEVLASTTLSQQSTTLSQQEMNERQWSGVEAAIEVFTTRPDTIFGVSFMVLAPEHPLVEEITTAEYKDAVENYKKTASLKTERDRQSDVKNITGQFTGAYAIHPFTGDKVQIWIGDYVLASYGTGAVMAVPCGDQRDWDFAKHFNLEIKNIFADKDISEEAYTEKDAVISNSDFLNGLETKVAMQKAIEAIEAKEIGKGKTNYRLRDAVFSRQRYWGEPFPVYYKNGLPVMIETQHLPIILPEVENYLPTVDGQPPLGNAKTWAWDTTKNEVVSNELINNETIFPLELNTMPGWAGSSWYFLRYMDAQNEAEFVSKKQADYWGQVDLYIGGSEHGTGHLLYSRFWTKFLFDQGFINFDEPFKKMINQGMILGRSSLVYRLDITFSLKEFDSNSSSESIGNTYISKYLFSKNIANSTSIISIPESHIEALPQKIESNIKDEIITLGESIGTMDSEKFNYDIFFTNLRFTPLHVDISIVDNDKLDIEAFKKWRSDYADAEFICEEDGTYICGHEVEKMSKSKFNVQTPDELVEKFGADTLRMYEMFLGPLEQSKPWDTKGINGVHNFLRKLCRLFEGELTAAEPTKESLKTIHRTIKKIGDDLERFSFNTGVSNFMICVNELTDQKCNNKAILQELVILLSSYAPHLCEELWVKLGNEAGTLSYAKFPTFDESVLVEANFSYPVSFNGKVRFKVELPLAMTPQEVEKEVMSKEEAKKYLEGKDPKKVIVVPGRIVNVVL